MPRGDRTGPWGMGPLTGRRAGYCADYDVPGFANPVPGRGYARGWGRGWRHRFYATGRPRWAYEPAWDYPPPLTREQELEGLRHEAQWLKGQLDAIGRRIEDFEGE
jgi:hypothetical protein